MADANATPIQEISVTGFSLITTRTYGFFTKAAQATGPENIGPERPLPGLLAPGPVLSPSRITLENNGKIRPQSDRENAFARSSGGDDEIQTRIAI